MLNPVADCSVNIQLTPQQRKILVLGDILPMQALLELLRNTLGQDRRKQILDLLELFRRNIFVIVLFQNLERIGKHIVDIPDQNAFIIRHGTHHSIDFPIAALSAYRQTSIPGAWG